MLTLDKQTLQTPLSLLPLRAALTAALAEAPAFPPHTDHNEQLAITLIARMRAEFQKPVPPVVEQEQPSFLGFRLQEVIGEHA